MNIDRERIKRVLKPHAQSEMYKTYIRGNIYNEIDFCKRWGNQARVSE